jgi:LacI family transcriptional regulator
MSENPRKPKDRPPSLRRLADACGLSYQSVSRILNGDTEHHNPDTVAKVQTVARALGYRRNLLARGILTGKSATVAVLLPFHVDYEMNTRLMIGAQRHLVEAGYAMVACMADGSARDLERVYELIERRVEGVIFRAHPLGTTDKIIEELHQHHVPVVAVVDNDPALAGAIDYVGSDEEIIGRTTAEQLWALGHRHFAFTRLGDTRFDVMLQRRFNAFAQRLDELGSDHTLVTTPPSGSSDPDFEAIVRLLQTTPRPTAVVASVDDIAYTVYRACGQLGLAVPADVSVVGSSNFRVSAMMTPPLDSFDQNPEEIGQVAASRVLERIKARGKKPAPKLLLIAPTAIRRGSSAPPKPPMALG